MSRCPVLIFSLFYRISPVSGLIESVHFVAATSAVCFQLEINLRCFNWSPRLVPGPEPPAPWYFQVKWNCVVCSVSGLSAAAIELMMKIVFRNCFCFARLVRTFMNMWDQQNLVTDSLSLTFYSAFLSECTKRLQKKLQYLFGQILLRYNFFWSKTCRRGTKWAPPTPPPQQNLQAGPNTTKNKRNGSVKSRERHRCFQEFKTHPGLLTTNMFRAEPTCRTSELFWRRAASNLISNLI